MHLDIGLPLLSELDQLRRTFWQNHKLQNSFHNQDKTLESPQQVHCLQPQKQSTDRTEVLNASNHTELNQLTQSQDRNSSPDKPSDRQNHEVRSENNHQSEDSEDKRQTCCTSTDTHSDKNGSETNENNNPSAQPKCQREPSRPLQVNNSLRSQSSIPRTCRASWDKASEDSSFL